MRRSSGPFKRWGSSDSRRSPPRRSRRLRCGACSKKWNYGREVRDQAILYTLLYTGLRVGDLAHLRVADVSLSERKGTIIVRGDHAKGGKQREVPVPREARERLARYLDHYPTRKGILFLGQRGALGEDAIGRIVGKYATWAKLEHVTPHVLRHSFAYNYLEKTGNDLIGLANILGHENVTTTQFYT
jgi:site-specific recombinase XerD